MKLPEQHGDIDAVVKALDIANEQGMAAEAVWSAMRAYAKWHQASPETYTMEWAFECALNEWDI